MKTLSNEIKMLIAEKLIYWAICIIPTDTPQGKALFEHLVLKIKPPVNKNTCK